MIKVFSHWIHLRTILQIFLDIAFPFGFTALAILLWGLGGQDDQSAILGYAVIYALVMVLCNYWLGLYSRTMAQKRGRAVLSIYLSIPIAYVLFLLLSVVDKYQDLPLLSGIAVLLGTLVCSLCKMSSGMGSLTSNRILIFGAGREARMVGRVLRKSASDIQIVGFYPGPAETRLRVPESRLLPHSRSLSETAMELNVGEIVIAVQERRGGVLPLRELLDCKLSGIEVLDLASYFERALGQIRLDSLRAGWLIFGEGFRQGMARTFIKRLFDILVSIALLVAASPVMLATVLLIVLEDGFPIFYRQERVGLDGHSFNVIKFRSMRTDAERDGKPRWATANDDRITRVGRVIRKLRIDELPQIFNVLRDDMSLVGPRPERPYFVDKLSRDIPFYAVRHSVKPGVTGWAQVSYPYGDSVDDSAQKLQYDLYYVKNHSLFLDIVILFETVGVVLTGKGAQ
jgi:sugar transferase (PEP-CTERM system associated)